MRYHPVKLRDPDQFRGYFKICLAPAFFLWQFLRRKFRHRLTVNPNPSDSTGMPEFVPKQPE